MPVLWLSNTFLLWVCSAKVVDCRECESHGLSKRHKQVNRKENDNDKAQRLLLCILFQDNTSELNLLDHIPDIAKVNEENDSMTTIFQKISNPRLIPVAQLSPSLHRHTNILKKRNLTSPPSISVVLIAILLISSHGYAYVRFEAHAS
ncbi:hypothetical protein LXL04_026281 [Taraxacum kok-saghyz]